MGDADQSVSPADAAQVLDDLVQHGTSTGRLSYVEAGALRVLLRHARRPHGGAAPTSILAAWNDIVRLVGREGASPASVVDRVAVLAAATRATGGEPPRQTRAPEGVTPIVGDLVGGSMKIEDGAVQTSTILPSAPTVAWESIGEITEHVAYEGPVQTTLYECRECGTPVARSGREAHERWHALVGVWSVPGE